MHSNLFMYLTAMSAVSIHNLVNNINEAVRSVDEIYSRTLDTNWTLTETLSKMFPLCNGTKQSPININTLEVKENFHLRLGLTAYDKPISGILRNHFPTFQLVPFSFKWPRPDALVSSSLARSFNPYADSHFTLNYVQFYWSQSDQMNSSMHRVDGVDSPIEIHFIHFNTAYSSLEEAFSKPDGLLIFAVMAIPSTHESYVFDRILDELGNITEYGQQVPIEEETTWRSLLPTDTSRFYRYQGSMVLPPCHESVQWVVFEEKLKLGQKQIRRLRRHRFMSKDMRDNREIDWSIQRRTTQSARGRSVERSFSLRTNKGTRYTQ